MCLVLPFMKMPLFFASTPCLERLARLALLPAAALCLLGTLPAAAQQKAVPALSSEARQAQKTAEEKERQRLRKNWETERKELQKKRAVIEEQRLLDEKLCYQKFAVEGCLAEARRVAREKDAPLRARELNINDLERKEKAAERLKAIEEKKADNAAVPMKSQQREKESRNGPGAKGSAARPSVDEAAAQAQRQAEAQQRAAKQAEYVRSHEQNRAKAEQGRAEREAKAKADYAAKLKAAEDHKASSLKKAQESGAQKSAPLPPPPQ